DRRGADARQQDPEPLDGLEIQVPLGVQAFDARRAGDALELRRVVLHVRGMAFVAALREAVEQRDGVALPPAVNQRPGNKQQSHVTYPRRRLSGPATLSKARRSSALSSSRHFSL